MCDVRGAVETHCHGWSKRVILTDRRAFLFPRDHTHVAHIEREAAALTLLRACGHAPRLINRHEHDGISPYPFLEIERVPGAPFYGAVYEAADMSVVIDLLTELGEAIAGWHDWPLGGLAPALRTGLARPTGLLERCLNAEPSQLVDEATAVLGVSGGGAWVEAIDAVQSMAPALTHGDIHGEQVMVANGSLVGVIDWETAAIDNPVRDFNFQEWGRGWYRAHETDFATMRETFWQSYSANRAATPLPDWRQIHLFFSLIEAWQCATSDTAFDVSRRELALVNLRTASS
ncbi:MAG: aminoglycoside phosphotransferase family protein [Actinomycetota bacterium]